MLKAIMPAHIKQCTPSDCIKPGVFAAITFILHDLSISSEVSKALNEYFDYQI